MDSKEDETTEMTVLEEEICQQKMTNFIEENLLQDQPEEKANKNISLTKASRQIFASLASLSVWLCIGIGGGFSAVLLPQLLASDSDLPITEDQASWIASLLALSTGIGAVASSILVDKIGRRGTTQLMTIPILISWLVMASANHVASLYAARVLIGIACGMGMPSTMYVTEVAHPSLRVPLCNMALLWASTGGLLAYILGACFPWRVAAAICGVFPVITFITLIFVPESPRWLLVVRREKASEKAIQWFYRKYPELAVKELEVIKLEVTVSQSGPKPTFLQRLKQFFEPNVLKPLGILFGFFIFQQLSGVYILLFYTVDLLQRSESSLDPFTATILVGVVRVCTSVAAVMAARPIGRRPLSMFSGLGMAVSMITAGTCLYFIADGDPVAGWISITCILLYMVFSGVGFLCLPWTMCSELLPLHARGIGGGVCNTVNHFFMFTVLKAYPFVADYLQGSGMLLLFGFASLLGCVFVFFFLPETIGKTLLEIEENFNSKRKEKKQIYTKEAIKDLT